MAAFYVSYKGARTALSEGFGIFLTHKDRRVPPAESSSLLPGAPVFQDTNGRLNSGYHDSYLNAVMIISTDVVQCSLEVEYSSLSKPQ